MRVVERVFRRTKDVLPISTEWRVEGANFATALLASSLLTSGGKAVVLIFVGSERGGLETLLGPAGHIVASSPRTYTGQRAR